MSLDAGSTELPGSPAETDIIPTMVQISETPYEFTSTREGVEGVVMHIGLNSSQVILVASDGEWLRYVVPSMEAAREVCERLKIPCHEGWPDHLRQAVASYKRSPEDWAAAPYPERTRGSST